MFRMRCAYHNVLVLCDLKGSHPDWSRISVACWTTYCVKGFLPFGSLAFTHVHLDVTTSKLCKDLMFGKSVWRCVYKIYGLFRWRN